MCVFIDLDLSGETVYKIKFRHLAVKTILCKTFDVIFIRARPIVEHLIG